jgi:DNA-binding XRE family transcriptional regulator
VRVVSKQRTSAGEQPGEAGSAVSEAAAAEETARPDLAGVHALRREIRTLIKEARQAKSITQADLGTAVGASRFTINRIETGAIDVGRRVADQLQRILELPQLPGLVAKRDRLLATAENERDLVVRRLLSTPALESVTIVAADDIDIYGMIYDSGAHMPLLDAQAVRVVFPAVQRERQLFGGQPLYGHVEYQIKRLADLQGSEDRPFGNLSIFESDDVLASCVIASTRTGTECAFWPPMQTDGKIRSSSLPVATSVDPHTTGRVEHYADELIRGREPIHTNEALCRIDPGVPGAANPPEARFTRYFAVGTDQEEDVEDDEGFAVALVLVIALCPRKHHGVARRAVTYKRPSARHDRERLSLFSNNVDDADIRAARAIESGQPVDDERSTRGALAAALDINGYLSATSGVIPDLAYQLCASREFATFGLEVAAQRIRRVPLPTELQLIRKPGSRGKRRAAVAPRLFILELESSGAQPELDRLGASADIEEIGIDDVKESNRLNDFMLEARMSGFLVPLLERLEVAAQ